MSRMILVGFPPIPEELVTPIGQFSGLMLALPRKGGFQASVLLMKFARIGVKQPKQTC